MFDEKILAKIFAHENMKGIPEEHQHAVINAVDEVLEEDAREYPFLYLAHTFQGNITENLKEE